MRSELSDLSDRLPDARGSVIGGSHDLALHRVGTRPTAACHRRADREVAPVAGHEEPGFEQVPRRPRAVGTLVHLLLPDIGRDEKDRPVGPSGAVDDGAVIVRLVERPEAGVAVGDDEGADAGHGLARLGRAAPAPRIEPRPEHGERSVMGGALRPPGQPEFGRQFAGGGDEARRLPAPITAREIQARLLLGPHADPLRKLLWHETTASRIFEATREIQSDLAHPSWSVILPTGPA